MIIIKIVLMVFPSVVKIWFLRACGAKIGSNCHIGISIIDSMKVEIGDNVYIGHFNLIWRLKDLKLENGSRISLLNWITGGRTGGFYLGRNSSISVNHFFEASGNIFIGDNCIIAGRSSQLFTHGITPANLDDVRPIRIGDWCYIGSAVRMVPGVRIADHNFVGMGSVVGKSIERNYVLIAGSPAVVKRELSVESEFFIRSHLPQAHHPSTYRG